VRDEESRRSGKIWRPRGPEDPAPNNHDLASYEEMCEVTLGPNHAGQARRVSGPDELCWNDGIAGVVSRTAYGDDLYPVFQVVQGEEVVGLYIGLDGSWDGDEIGSWLRNAARKGKS
jgi:hypothetical protein